MQNLKNTLKINVLSVIVLFCLIFVSSVKKTDAQLNNIHSNSEFSYFTKNQSFATTQSNDFVHNKADEKSIYLSKPLVTQRSYPLIVRGGRGLRLSTENTKTQALVKLIVEFTFATHKADDGLRSGQGSWMDRGGRQGEPARIEYFAQEDDAKKIIDYLKGTGSYYTFECYNGGKGYLQATRAYTKKVRID